MFLLGWADVVDSDKFGPVRWTSFNQVFQEFDYVVLFIFGAVATVSVDDSAYLA